MLQEISKLTNKAEIVGQWCVLILNGLLSYFQLSCKCYQHKLDFIVKLIKCNEIEVNSTWDQCELSLKHAQCVCKDANNTGKLFLWRPEVDFTLQLVHNLTKPAKNTILIGQYCHVANALDIISFLVKWPLGYI